MKLAGQAGTIGVTAGHPIWSLDRGGWVGAGELEPGERLATANGPAVVQYILPLPGQHRVYNLAVEAEHRYFVSDAALLAHNADGCRRQRTPTPNQMNKDIGTGKAPRSVKRVDIAKMPNEQVHVHFRDGSALNIDGTWKHGFHVLTNAEIDWLKYYGWTVPS